MCAEFEELKSEIINNSCDGIWCMLGFEVFCKSSAKV